MTSFFSDLEDQLRQAAHQRTAGVSGEAAQPASARGGRWRRLAGGLRAIPVLAAVAVTLAVVVGALVLLGHRGQPASPTASSGPGNSLAAIVSKTPQAQLKREFKFIAGAGSKVARQPACQLSAQKRGGFAHRAPGRALLSTLGVLRRPATATDRIDLRSFGVGGEGMTVYADGARRALTTGGTTYYLVPIHLAGSAAYPSPRCFTLQQQALRQALPTIAANLRAPTLALQAAYADYDRALTAAPADDGVCVVGTSRRSTFSECGETLSAVKRPSVPSDDDGAYVGVVPDGVASVTLRFPATPSRAAASVTAIVHNNIFVARGPSLAERTKGTQTLGPTVVWTTAGGTVIKSLTPPTAAALQRLCLNQPKSCTPMMTFGSGSTSSGHASGHAETATVAPKSATTTSSRASSKTK